MLKRKGLIHLAHVPNLFSLKGEDDVGGEEVLRKGNPE